MCVCRYEEEKPEYHMGLNISRSLHQPAYLFAEKAKATGEDFKIQAATPTGGIWLKFKELCASCMPEPQLLDSNVTHKGRC